MSVQVRLGRWRTRDGSVAEVLEFNQHASPRDYRWSGRVIGGVDYRTWDDEGRVLRSQPSHDDDLIEPLDAPTDLAAFIAGLKPGDYYADKLGHRCEVIAIRDGYLWAFTDSGPRTVGLSDDTFWAYPAGPWVEPPKPQVCYVSYDDSKSTFGGWEMHLKRETAERTPHARELIWTEGKGFELGEVVKQ